MSIQWTDDLATGIEEIDRQHRELYRQIGLLHSAMKDGAIGRVPAVLEFLASYALDHFADEERAMEATRYPGLEAHRAAHRRFAEEYAAWAAKAAPGRLTASTVIELSGWLGGWLRDHVRRVDGAMAIHLRGRAEGGAVSPRR